MSENDKAPTISAIQIEYNKSTGGYTLLIGVKEGEDAHKYVVPPEDAVSFHEKLQSALALAQEAHH